MAEMKDVVKLALDCYHNRTERYSKDESLDTLRQAMIAANNGSTTLDYRAIRDGKCTGLFTLIEEIVDRTVVEGLQTSDFFYSLVDFRNVALGDRNEFVIEDKDLFEIADAAESQTGVRRQRIGGRTKMSVPTTLKVVKVYEEMNRVLTGLIDFNDFISKISDSFQQRLLDDVYTLWSNATADDYGDSCFLVAGAYNEDSLLDMIAHVEAENNGSPVTLLGTKKAIRSIKPSMDSNDLANELYHKGYCGTFYGSSVVVLPQRHKIGTKEWVFPDNVIHVVSGDDRPIKCVYEGDTLILSQDPMDMADMTYNYFMSQRWGLMLAINKGNGAMGRYTIV